MKITGVTVYEYDASWVHGAYGMSHGRLGGSHRSWWYAWRRHQGVDGWAETCPNGRTYLPSFVEGERAALGAAPAPRSRAWTHGISACSTRRWTGLCSAPTPRRAPSTWRAGTSSARRWACRSASCWTSTWQDSSPLLVGGADRFAGVDGRPRRARLRRGNPRLPGEGGRRPRGRRGPGAGRAGDRGAGLHGDRRRQRWVEPAVGAARGARARRPASTPRTTLRHHGRMRRVAQTHSAALDPRRVRRHHGRPHGARTPQEQAESTSSRAGLAGSRRQGRSAMRRRGCG